MDTFYLQDGDDVHRVDVERAKDVYIFADHGDEEIEEDRVLVEMGYEPGSQCSKFVGMLNDRHFIEAFTTSQIWPPEVVARFLIELVRAWSVPALPPENYIYTVSIYRSDGGGKWDEYEITPKFFVDKLEEILDLATKENKYMDPEDDEEYDELQQAVLRYYDVAREYESEVESTAVASLDDMSRCVGDIWSGAYNLEGFYRNALNTISEAFHVAINFGEEKPLEGDALAIAVFFAASDMLRINASVTQQHKDEL